MYDYHMHSKLSFDSEAEPMDMAQEAKRIGLREICFTDHYDFNSEPDILPNLFSLTQYREYYDCMHIPGLTIRKGVEFGLTRWNKPALKALIKQYPFDFVLGSVHFVDGHDPYERGYWQGKAVHEAFRRYLEEVYHCVAVHDDFDVLGHLTYACKSTHNPIHEPILMEDHCQIVDEILKTLAAKEKGLEVNTSGVDPVGVFLPSVEYLLRFKELGGRIVTIGSDAHTPERVGQYSSQALDMLSRVFGYVCTFEGRKPVFHKL